MSDAIRDFTIPTQTLEIHGLRCGRGPSLVLLHGWPEFSRVWSKLMTLLAPHFDLIAPDLRGFGRTRVLDDPRPLPTPALLADDLRDMLEHLGVKPAGLIAHDVGAGVAQYLAAESPGIVSRLFFFNCPYPGIGRRWAEPDHLKEVWYQYFHQLDFAAQLVGSSRDACRIYLKHFLDHWSANPGVFDNDLELWVDNFLANDNLRGGFAWYRAINDARIRSMKEDLAPSRRIMAPAYFLWGRHDPLLKAEWTDRLGEYFANPYVEIAEDAGHYVHYECPELAASRIRAFFSD